MIVLIGLYFGLTGISTIIGIIGANVAMILFSWLQEQANPPGRTTTTILPFWFGTVAGRRPRKSLLAWQIFARSLAS